MASPAVSPSAAPRPILIGRLGTTEKALRSALFDGGITGPTSPDLSNVLSALKVLDGQNPQLEPQAIALATALQKWQRANHPGEMSVLGKSAAYKTLDAWARNFPPYVLAPLPPPPLKFVGVGLYTVPNNGKNHTLGLQARMQNMREAVGKLSDWLATLNQSMLQLDNPFLGIFIAPEYYFTRPSNSGQRDFLSYDSMQQVEAALKELSKSYPRILIIPGTTHYDVQLSSDDKVQAGYQLLKAAKDRILRENALKKPKTVLGATMSHDAVGAFSKVPSMNEMADSLLDKTTVPSKVHNCTWFLLGGTPIARYDKHSDFYEGKSISPDQSMFIPGTQEECPEIGDSVRKFRFGAEICFDHANGILKRRNPSNLSFHVCVSDYVDTMPANMAMKNGGYFLHASTNFKESVLYRRAHNGSLANVRSQLWKTGWYVGPGRLDVYEIQLPNP